MSTTYQAMSRLLVGLALLFGLLAVISAPDTLRADEPGGPVTGETVTICMDRFSPTLGYWSGCTPETEDKRCKLTNFDLYGKCFPNGLVVQLGSNEG